MPAPKARFKVGARVRVSPLIYLPPFITGDLGTVREVSKPHALRAGKSAWGGRRATEYSEARYRVECDRPGASGWVDESALHPNK